MDKPLVSKNRSFRLSASLNLRPRWRKVIKDLWLDRSRTLLVVLAMAIGVFGVGVVAVAYPILTREMQANYLGTNPASAIFTLDSIDERLVAEVEALPYVAQAEMRKEFDGRVQVGPDEWRKIQLFVIPSFEALRVDTFRPESGAWPPGLGEILIERAALPVAQAKVGEPLVVRLPGKPEQALAVVGTAHAPGEAPAWMEGWAYGYLTPETLALLGGDPQMDELRVVFTGDLTDEAHIRQQASELQAWIEARSRSLSRLEVPRPGKHPHADQMASLLFLLESFGLLALVLSGVLVANQISALLANQVRQIAVMKAIGGRRRQITGMYLVTVLILGLAGLAVGMPIALAAGRGYARFAADMLNFNLYSAAVPPWAFAIQVAIGLLIPVLAALYPVARGTRITVRQALSDYGVSQASILRVSALDRWLARMRGLSRPFLLSLRNTFRRRGRMILTLVTLSAGGAIFLAAINVSASIERTTAIEMDAQRFDLMVSFSQPYPNDRITEVIKGTAGVTGLELRSRATAVRIRPDGSEASRSFRLVALPADSQFFIPTMLEGRWLSPGRENEMVINHKILNNEPDLGVGDEIQLKTGSLVSTWTIVGVAREAIGIPAAYVPYTSFANLSGQTGSADSAAVVTAGHSREAQADAARALERSLEASGLNVANMQPMFDMRQVIEDHLKLIAAFLTFASVLVVLVGGLGLASTLSMNVLERRREIGVMRAIGASNRAILRMIVAEGIFIGVLSWLLACLATVPLSVLVGNIFGNIFFQVPLYIAISPTGMGVWLFTSLLIAAAASFIPARGAAGLTVRETLAYE